MKKVQLEVWTTFDKLCLISAITKLKTSFADQNWVTISRYTKQLYETVSTCIEYDKRNDDWFSAKQCAAQYELLMKGSGVRKKKRIDRNTDYSDIHEALLTSFTQDFCEELQQSLSDIREEYSITKKIIEDIDTDKIDEEKLEELITEMEEKEKATDIKSKLKSMLDEKSAIECDSTSKSLFQQTLMPNEPSTSGEQKSTNITTSPLLTSLLQSPSPLVRSSPSTSSPTISLLLHSSPSVSLSDSTLSKLLETPTSLPTSTTSGLESPSYLFQSGGLDPQQQRSMESKIKNAQGGEEVSAQKLSKNTEEYEKQDMFDDMSDIEQGVVESEVIIENESSPIKRLTPRRLDMEQVEEEEPEEEILETVEEIIERVEEAIIETVGENNLNELVLSETIETVSISDDEIENINIEGNTYEVIVVGSHEMAEQSSNVIADNPVIIENPQKIDKTKNSGNQDKISRKASKNSEEVNNVIDVEPVIIDLDDSPTKVVKTKDGTNQHKLVKTSRRPSSSAEESNNVEPVVIDIDDSPTKILKTTNDGGNQDKFVKTTRKPSSSAEESNNPISDDPVFIEIDDSPTKVVETSINDGNHQKLVNIVRRTSTMVEEENNAITDEPVFIEINDSPTKVVEPSRNDGNHHKLVNTDKRSSTMVEEENNTIRDEPVFIEIEDSQTKVVEPSRNDGNHDKLLNIFRCSTPIVEEESNTISDEPVFIEIEDSQTKVVESSRNDGHHEKLLNIFRCSTPIDEDANNAIAPEPLIIDIDDAPTKLRKTAKDNRPQDKIIKETRSPLHSAQEPSNTIADETVITDVDDSQSKVVKTTIDSGNQDKLIKTSKKLSSNAEQLNLVFDHPAGIEDSISNIGDTRVVNEDKLVKSPKKIVEGENENKYIEAQNFDVLTEDSNKVAMEEKSLSNIVDSAEFKDSESLQKVGSSEKINQADLNELASDKTKIMSNESMTLLQEKPSVVDVQPVNTTEENFPSLISTDQTKTAEEHSVNENTSEDHDKTLAEDVDNLTKDCLKINTSDRTSNKIIDVIAKQSIESDIPPKNLDDATNSAEIIESTTPEKEVEHRTIESTTPQKKVEDAIIVETIESNSPQKKIEDASIPITTSSILQNITETDLAMESCDKEHSVVSKDEINNEKELHLEKESQIEEVFQSDESENKDSEINTGHSDKTTETVVESDKNKKIDSHDEEKVKEQKSREETNKSVSNNDEKDVVNISETVFSQQMTENDETMKPDSKEEDMLSEVLPNDINTEAIIETLKEKESIKDTENVNTCIQSDLSSNLVIESKEIENAAHNSSQGGIIESDLSSKQQEQLNNLKKPLDDDKVVTTTLPSVDIQKQLSPEKTHKTSDDNKSLPNESVSSEDNQSSIRDKNTKIILEPVTTEEPFIPVDQIKVEIISSEEEDPYVSEIEPEPKPGFDHLNDETDDGKAISSDDDTNTTDDDKDDGKELDCQTSSLETCTEISSVYDDPPEFANDTVKDHFREEEKAYIKRMSKHYRDLKIEKKSSSEIQYLRYKEKMKNLAKQRKEEERKKETKKRKPNVKKGNKATNTNKPVKEKLVKVNPVKEKQIKKPIKEKLLKEKRTRGRPCKDKSSKNQPDNEKILKVGRRKHLSSVDSKPGSPSLSTASSDEDRDYKSWKKSIFLVYNRLASHKFASVFSKPITENEAPSYHQIILRPMDLSTIKRNIENGTIRTTVEFQRDMLLMVQNAIIYNKYDTPVYDMAKVMGEDMLTQMEVMVQALGDGVPLIGDTVEEKQITRARTSKSSVDAPQNKKRKNRDGDESRPKRNKLSASYS